MASSPTGMAGACRMVCTVHIILNVRTIFATGYDGQGGSGTGNRRV